MEKRALILEGPNGIGKDVFLNTLLEYCPYYKVHYAGSGIIKDFNNELTGEDLSKMGYAAFETIHTSIEKDSSEFPHIQYRSLMTNLIYNALFRYDEQVEKNDYEYMMRFFHQKYTDKHVFWISSYDEEYLKNLSDDEISTRLRKRPDEIENILKINRQYQELYERLKDDQSIRCNLVLTTGVGNLDILKDVDRQLQKFADRHQGQTAYVVSESCIDTTRAALLQVQERYPLMSVGRKICEYAVELSNPNSQLINSDFFTVYAVCNLRKKMNVEYVASDDEEFYIEKYLKRYKQQNPLVVLPQPSQYQKSSSLRV